MNMESLPNELLNQIASHLNEQPPSITRFDYEPSVHITECDYTPLKNLSLVSWRWRNITLPILFRYSRIAIDKNPQWVPVDARLVDSMQAQLTTLSNHELRIYHKMRSKVKSSSASAFDEALDDLLISLHRIEEGDNFLEAVPHSLWLPHLPKTFQAFGRFITQYKLKPHVKSVVVYTDKEYELPHVDTADAALARAVLDIWSSIFKHLNPTRVVVAAPPATLAGLLDTQVLTADTWAFEMKMHYIELLQNELLGEDHMEAGCRPWNSALIHRRPWSHLGYNESSSITAYSTYEFHLKESPMMLCLILVRLAKEVPPHCNITSFSFTGVFPFVTKIRSIIRSLQRLPSLERIAFQLAPGPENNSLEDPERMGRAQRSDFWLEWSDSYRSIVGFLGGAHFTNGAEFRSRDCVNKQLADDVTNYFERLRQQDDVKWRKSEAEAGVWIRDHSLDQDVTFETEADVV